MYSNSTYFEDTGSTLFGQDISSKADEVNDNLKLFNLGDRLKQVHAFIMFLAFFILISLMILKWLFYDFTIGLIKTCVKWESIGIAPKEIFLNNFYRGLDEHQFEKFRSQNVKEIEFLENLIQERSQ